MANLFELAAKLTLDSSDYEKGIEAAKQAAANFSKGLTAVVTATQNADKVVNAAADSAEQFSTQTSNAADSAEEFRQAETQVTRAAEESANSMSDAADEAKDLSRELDRAESEFDDTEDAVDDYTESADDAEKSTRKLGDEEAKTTKKTSAFVDTLKGMLSAKALIAVFEKVTNAIVGFAKSSIEAGMNFDKSMSQVAATMGTTVDQIQDLRDFAQEMGAKTAFSATQAADALNYMALAGYDAKASMDMLPNVLNLAAAGGMELASASDMITDSQSALGLTLDETSKLVDKMAKASSKSNTSVTQLGEAILTVGGTAKNLAGGTTELSAALGILADNGTKGAEGGTKLRNIILSLGAPTDTAAKALNKLGVTAYDADGNMRPLQDTFSDLNKAMENMTTAEKTDIINTVFNKTDIKDVNALLATSADRWDELSAAIDESAGAAQAMADTQLDNLAGDITLFQSALEGAQIAISDGISPTLRKFVQFGSDGLSRLTESFKEDGLAGAMDTFGEILSDGIAKISAWLPTAVSIGTDLLLTIIEGLISALPELGTAAIQIIANLANGLAAAAPDLIPAAVEAIVELAMALIAPENIANLVDAAINLVMSLATGLVDALPILIDAVPDIIEALVVAVSENGWELLGAAAELIVILAKGLIDAIPHLLAAIPRILEALFTTFIEFGTDIGSRILETIGNFFKEIIDNAFTFTAELMANIQKFLADLPNKIGFALGYVLGSIIKFGLNAIEWARSAPKEIVQTVVNWFFTLPGRIADIFGTVIKNVIHFGINMRSRAVSAAINTVSGIINAFTSLPGKMTDIGGNIVKGLWKGINDMKNWVINKVKGFGDSVMAGIKSALGIASPSKITRGFGRFVSQGLALGIIDDSGKPISAMKSLSDKVVDAIDIDKISNSITPIGDFRISSVQSYGYQGASTEQLLMLILETLRDMDESMYERISSAIDGMAIDWNDRELGRFVKSYA